MPDYNSAYTGAQIDANLALAATAQQPPAEGPFVDGDKTKLDGIEPGADVTDTTNVTAAGALMDSEVTNLAAVKAFDPTDYATAAQGTLADSAVQPGDQLTSAFTATIDDDGTQSTGTYTPSTAEGSNYKKIVNGGAFTLAPVAMATGAATTLSILIVNNATAGAITTSGFTKVTGDAFTTTDTHKFMCRIEVFDLAGVEYSFLNVVALQ